MVKLKKARSFHYKAGLTSLSLGFANTMKNLFFSLFCLNCTLFGWQANSASVVGGGYEAPTPIKVSPGQIITFFVHGIAMQLTDPVAANSTPLPTSLAGISATFLQNFPSVPVPILRLEPLATCFDTTRPGCAQRFVAVTVQIPFDISAENPQVRLGGMIPSASIRFTDNGVVAATVDVTPIVDSVHILRSCDLLFARRTFACNPAVTHADGTLVSRDKPAKTGEEITLFATGLGYTMPLVANGQAGDANASTSAKFRLSFDARPNASVSRPSSRGETGPGTADPTFTALIAGYVGLYQLNVIVPPLPDNIQLCDPNPFTVRVNSNLTINVFGPASVDGVGICVDPRP